ncbi:efflux RND transporter periplasmic adaptor subunit [Acinetobacter cumulans]|uniref:Efflux RND transporter periplasmic adaptor subunit n=4 Tax=Acinetobacter TaxID=469 RepID=A0A4Q7AEB7_9GAMM|nr:efflux RND transporter periplasmic adaptor subunit [Acinetobacter baumannii]PHM84079.1 efflux RND transporter periplasmic adaptor subunit [Acinetobacter nosocomialis]RFC83402.1 efflux RND transporter periplasmic adaptor subunit [Acinetobacter sichuanensis]RKG44336.1 efflux RND transporter periplasmic adaptor subunit [Acinetobacter sp. WCHAc060007]RKG54839.1 efflux RND transporter periplasmic adaptor subunit [Acinetobacter cumulans]RLL20067.1 efflux RND transporter periplasmic adaptor subuni
MGCTQSKDAEQSAAEMPPVVVSTITVLPQSMNVIENLPGRVTAYRIAEIRPQVGGIVDKVLFKQGSYVQAGQPLFKLNSEIFQADVKSNQATLNRAQAEVTRLQVLLKRYTELVKVNAVSQQEYNNTEADYKKAKADVAQMQAMLSRQQLNLKYATVTAPISGTIGEILVTEGALVGQGDSNAMAVIQQINKVYVDVKQSISDYEKLQEALQQGDVSNIKHTVEILNSQGKPYNVTGEILFSDTKVDPDTGDVTIRILVNNQNQKLLPGMYVRVNMSRAQVENALLVPEQAIQHDINGKANVTIVNQKGLAQSKPIQLGQRYQNSYVVTQGLQAGEKVIVEGADRIQPEQKLKIKQWQPTNTQESGGKK